MLVASWEAATSGSETGHSQVSSADVLPAKVTSRDEAAGVNGAVSLHAAYGFVL